MDPTYQQMMVQQLMGQGTMPAGMGGQNASTPYGIGMMTGNQMMPNAVMPQGGSGAAPMGQGMYGMLNQAAPSSVLQQPMATYGGGA